MIIFINPNILHGHRTGPHRESMIKFIQAVKASKCDVVLINSNDKFPERFNTISFILALCKIKVIGETHPLSKTGDNIRSWLFQNKKEYSKYLVIDINKEHHDISKRNVMIIDKYIDDVIKDKIISFFQKGY